MHFTARSRNGWMTAWMIGILLAFAARGQNVSTAATSVARVSEPIMPPSPVGQFRNLLQMTQEEQERFLTNKNPTQAAVLRRKFIEYSNLSAQEREWRFRQLELCRWILPLMFLDNSTRESRLMQIPSREQPIVLERLREWDRLSPAQKETVREDKTVLSYFFRPEPEFVERQLESLTILPPELKLKMEQELASWRQRATAERQQMRSRLRQLLQMDQEERNKILIDMAPAERAQLRSTLVKFQELTPEQRDQCIEGFGKLANLSESDRDLFIFSASRWAGMPAQQKALWRLIIDRVHHPLDIPPSPDDALLSPTLVDPNVLATNH